MFVAAVITNVCGCSDYYEGGTGGIIILIEKREVAPYILEPSFRCRPCSKLFTCIFPFHSPFLPWKYTWTYIQVSNQDQESKSGGVTEVFVRRAHTELAQMHIKSLLHGVPIQIKCPISWHLRKKKWEFCLTESILDRIPAVDTFRYGQECHSLLNVGFHLRRIGVSRWIWEWTKEYVDCTRHADWHALFAEKVSGFVTDVTWEAVVSRVELTLVRSTDTYHI